MPEKLPEDITVQLLKEFPQQPAFRQIHGGNLEKLLRTSEKKTFSRTIGQNFEKKKIVVELQKVEIKYSRYS